MNYTIGDTLKLDGIDLSLEKIGYDDIQAGDTLIHVVDDKRGPLQLWKGEATHGNTDWYGPTRAYAVRAEDDNFVVQGVREPIPGDDYGYLIAARWHAEEEGHALYRVN